jgi:predicted transcriptional regulator
MAEPDKRPVTMEELLISSLAQTDALALAQLLIEKGLITREEFMQKISEERATYQKLFNSMPQ